MTAIALHARRMAMLTPMWQRIANGEVDLSQFTDEEILTGRILMEDGRTLPQPHEFPDTWVQEQVKRGMRQAQQKVLHGGQAAIDLYLDILEDEEAPRGLRMEAAKWVANRYLGPAEQRLHVTHEHEGRDPREVLLERLMEARQIESTVIEGEIVEDSLGLEDLL